MEVRLLSKRLTSLSVCLRNRVKLLQNKKGTLVLQNKKAIESCFLFSLSNNFFSAILPSCVVVATMAGPSMAITGLSTVQQSRSGLCHSLGPYSWLMALLPVFVWPPECPSPSRPYYVAPVPPIAAQGMSSRAGLSSAILFPGR